MLAMYFATLGIPGPAAAERFRQQPDRTGDRHGLAAVQDLSPSRSAYSRRIADPERVRQDGQGQRLVAGQGSQAR